MPLLTGFREKSPDLSFWKLGARESTIRAYRCAQKYPILRRQVLSFKPICNRSDVRSLGKAPRPRWRFCDQSAAPECASSVIATKTGGLREIYSCRASKLFRIRDIVVSLIVPARILDFVSARSANVS